MKIARIETHSVRIPIKPEYLMITSLGVHDVSDYTIVRVLTDEGIEGLGMTYPSPGIRDVIDNALKSVLIGRDPLDIEKIWNDMYWKVRGYGRKGIAFCAISAIDIGLWDLKAKIVNLPLYKLLGSYTSSVPVYGSGGWTNFTEKELIKEMTDNL